MNGPDCAATPSRVDPFRHFAGNRTAVARHRGAAGASWRSMMKLKNEWPALVAIAAIVLLAVML